MDTSFLKNEIIMSETSPYKDRFEFLTGTSQNEQENRASVAARFAPKTAGNSGDQDKLIYSLQQMFG